MTTVREALVGGTRRLANLETPFLDAALLLSHALGISKEKLLASYPDTIPLSAMHEFNNHVTKRLSGYPISYIRRKKEFFGLPFYVDERVLVPRPDTETLVEEVLKHIHAKSGTKKNLQVLDIGTGTGCIAITLKHLQPQLQLTATDISKSALAVCTLNSRHLLTEPLKLIESDLFAAISGTFDIIVSNPPYLTSREVAQMQEKHWPEPMTALEGGQDGLETIRILINDAYDHLAEEGALFLEAGIEQISAIEEIFLSRGYQEINSYPDLSGRNRVVSGYKPYVK
ncbi:MAG TPA: peptide chain release factor N(5)-glutamine methyltransferase [Clostridia bacterium]|nr:peptide chain release factor N(5)-glutamine methyltransferase [Clostridia bacterium]